MATAILQARTNSSRLPGKVLKPILGKPMVLRQIERLRQSNEIKRIVLATSDESSDDELAEVVSSAGIPVVRGPLNDVLKRFVIATEAFPDESFVRLTADCPLADAPIIDEVILLHEREKNDYTSNTHPRTFARGLDVEVIDISALEHLNSLELSEEEREHVTPGFYRRPNNYRLGNFEQTTSSAQHRWTVDFSEDFQFVVRVYECLFHEGSYFWQEEILSLLNEMPDLARFESDIN